LVLSRWSSGRKPWPGKVEQHNVVGLSLQLIYRVENSPACNGFPFRIGDFVNSNLILQWSQDILSTFPRDLVDPEPSAEVKIADIRNRDDMQCLGLCR
jgi:hypothetical protein